MYGTCGVYVHYVCHVWYACPVCYDLWMYVVHCYAVLCYVVRCVLCGLCTVIYAVLFMYNVRYVCHVCSVCYDSCMVFTNFMFVYVLYVLPEMYMFLFFYV